MSSDKASSLRAPAASPTPALSPLVQLLPTGYRDIQPFQRGQGWHSNGKATAKLRHARDATASERVVFPVIPTYYSGANDLVGERGPTASVVDERHDASRRDEVDDVREREHAERPVASPPISAIPVPPSQRPRRPSSGSHAESNQRGSSSSGSFRTRAIAASIHSSSQGDPLSPTATNAESAHDNSDGTPPPDPATMEKLWQEYNERTRHPTKTVDKETYHRKMQHRYNETKTLRERIARLEMELEDVQRERDEAVEAAQRSAQEAAAHSKKWKDPELDEPMASPASQQVVRDFPIASDDTPSHSVQAGLSPQSHVTRNFASLAARISMSHKHKQLQAITNAEEVSYREKAAKLERAMAVAKEGIAQLQARLVATHENDQETIEKLRAQLQLEQQASKLLSVQLRETNAAFRSTADELVSTQVALEKEQIEKQIIIEQIQAETRQLISDQRRKELQSRVKNVVRTLGKEALHQKMEALHTRVMTAEHYMRVAQLEVVRLKQERDLQQQKIDDMLSCREIKYHCLASSDGGIPGILQRATTLYQGTRTVSDQFLRVHMLYEDERGSASGLDARECLSDLEDGFSIHVVVYEAFTAQDDYITFHLRDIRRLVPDAEKYLARYYDHKKERYLELAELLFAQCHLGYKNGHVVLTERPSAQLEAAANEKREVVIYRGSRLLRSNLSGATDVSEKLLVDLVINEVHNPSTSQLWWLEVQGTVIDLDANQEHECRVTIDSHILKTIIPIFAGYRPSESMFALEQNDEQDEVNAFGIHEDLLEPLFARFEWRTDHSGNEPQSSRLLLMDADGISILCGQEVVDVTAVEGVPKRQVSFKEATEATDALETEEAEIINSRVLDHRSIVTVGGTFYCVRIEEIWDGELMVRVTMEEPDDATRRYQALLLERELSAISSHIFMKGLCTTDFSGVVKFGLPASLHEPLCRLLKKHATPIMVPEVDMESNSGQITMARISFDSMVQDLNSSDTPKSVDISQDIEDTVVHESSEDSYHQIVDLGESRVFERKRIAQVTIVGERMREHFVQELLEKVFLRRVKPMQRLGCRSETGLKFSMVAVYSQLETPFDGIVIIELSTINSTQKTSLQSAPFDVEVIVSRNSTQETLRLLGFRTVSSTIN